MKTSNIIFISILFMMFILLTAGVFISKHSANENEVNVKPIYLNIPAAKVIILENCKNLSFYKGDSSNIQNTGKNSMGSQVNYRVNGDTLSFWNIKSENAKNGMVIYISGKVNEFLLKNSIVSLNNFSGRLSLNAINSNVTLSPGKKKISFSKLGLTGKNNSYFEMKNFWIDSVNVRLADSRADLHVGIGVLEGSVLETSKLVLQSPREMSLKRDEFSRIQNY